MNKMNCIFKFNAFIFVHVCSNVLETVGISLTRKELFDLAKNHKDFEVQLSGQGGNIIVRIPSTYFEGFVRVF